MKNVMVRAWEIARTAAVRFGGKASEFFAAALRQAWVEIKNVKTSFALRADKNGKRSWIAKVTGTHPTYKLQREFLSPVGTDWLGNKVFELEDGYYSYDSIRERGYIKVENGKWTDVSYQEVAGAVA